MLKVVERVIEKIIRECIVIDDMQFGFIHGHGITDVIFIVRQLQEKFLDKNKNLYFAFIDLEKTFDTVPGKVLWWAMYIVCVREWIIVIVQCVMLQRVKLVMSVKLKLMYIKVRFNAHCFSL